MEKKTVVIGLDGCTLEQILPLVKKGLLPNLESLMRFGSWGTLISTIPPMTAPSWVSIGTGKNPGKTGVFDFWIPLENSYGYRIVNSKDVKCPYFWKIASEFGKRAVVINYPVTYPPEDFDGTLISGMLTPSLDSDFTIPHNLKKEIFDSDIDYRIDAGWSLDDTKDKNKFFKNILHCMSQRKKAALQIMDKGFWDLFVVVFTALDRIQHFFWHHQDPNHPEYKKDNTGEYEESVAHIYTEIDNIIGEFLYRIDRFWSLFIVSDHGFAPLHYLVYVNKILFDESLLAVKDEYKNEIMKEGDYKVDPFDLIHPVANVDIIDWKNTLCFMPTETCSGLRLNVEGREPEGIIHKSEFDERIDEIIGKLRNIKEPITNSPIFSDFFKRDDIYHGDYKDFAPDIIFSNHGIKGLPLTSLTSGAHLKPSSWRTGNHSPEGVFMACGNGIKQNEKVEYIDVYDVAPTVMYTLGLPVSSDMDGAVSFDIFTKDYTSRNPIQIMEAEIEDKEPRESENIHDDNEKRLISERLKGLGYL
ncbi:alkaline phosphatase family protein [bacterium]|nr:alkaline phosphatase family protein [bacterium]